MRPIAASRRAAPARHGCGRGRNQYRAQPDLGAALAGAVHEHDGEQDEDQHAAHVDEQLGEREEAEAEVGEQTGKREQERAETQRHAHDLAHEHDGQRAGQRDGGKRPEQGDGRRSRSRRHPLERERRPRGWRGRCRATGSARPAFVAARGTRRHLGAGGAEASPERTISSLSNRVYSLE